MSHKLYVDPVFQELHNFEMAHVYEIPHEPVVYFPSEVHCILD